MAFATMKLPIILFGAAQLLKHAARRHPKFKALELAARAYELEEGERPKSIADLVPAYLKAVPQDPLTGTNMVLR